MLIIDNYKIFLVNFYVQFIVLYLTSVFMMISKRISTKTTSQMLMQRTPHAPAKL